MSQVFFEDYKCTNESALMYVLLFTRYGIK
jgi:hypothetical protein